MNEFVNPNYDTPQLPQQPAQTNQIAPNKKRDKKWFIVSIASIIFLVLSLALAGWSFYNYLQQKTDVDTRIETAVAAAEKAQADSDEAKFAEREKQPYSNFAGPDDYGSLTFEYPKTWSVYVANDASDGGSYEAYLNPVSVPMVSDSQQFALRVTIDEQGYDEVISDYDSMVEDGDLKSSAVTVSDEIKGTRLDGKFSDDIRGSAVIFKIRDKTLVIRTDAETFKDDFNQLITTISFNQ